MKFVHWKRNNETRLERTSIFLKEVNSDVGEIKVILQALKAGQDQQYSPILSSMNSGVNDVKQKVEDDVANKEDITRLEKKMDELKEGQRERDAQSKNSGISKKQPLKALPRYM